jgi:hypothetical protein
MGGFMKGTFWSKWRRNSPPPEKRNPQEEEEDATTRKIEIGPHLQIIQQQNPS